MGILFIVATPIGNLKDITLRAIETLKGVDYVLCEDTRVTGRLLNELGIKKKMISLNEFNEDRKISQIIADLRGELSIALVSDAGTPLISDPGFKLVREAIGAGVKIESIPGPTAAIAALTASGLPPHKFLFLGFLPKKDGKRLVLLKNVKESTSKVNATAIIYESPYRVLKTLEQIERVFGDIGIVVCRELTKMHEEVRREKVSDSIKHYSETKPLGEFVILF